MAVNPLAHSADSSGTNGASQEARTVTEACEPSDTNSRAVSDSTRSRDTASCRLAAPLMEGAAASDTAVMDNGDRVGRTVLTPERPVKRPRLPAPVTSTLSPQHGPPLKQGRPDPHLSAVMQTSPPTGVPQLHTAPPPDATAASAAPVRAAPVRPLVKVAVKTPVSVPSAATLHTSPPLTTASVSSRASYSLSSTPTVTPRTTPTAPRLMPLHQRWTAMLEGVFAMDCQPHEMERVADVSTRIVASIPGSKEVAADTFLMLKANLSDEKNSTLRRRVLSGELPVEVLVTLNEKDLVNPERRKELDEGFEERSKDRNITEMMKAVQTTSKLFPCPSCKVRDCTWLQKQTRSGDEPMTVFCTCNKCGYKWKRF